MRGFCRNIIRKWNTRGIILMYHRVAKIASDPWGLCVTPNHFEDQINVLRKLNVRFTALQNVQQLMMLNFTRKNISITFDDGYVDNILNAKPILERYGVPATFFIITNTVGNNEEFWWDHLERLIVCPRRLPKVVTLKIKEKNWDWDIPQASEESTVSSRLEIYRKIWEVVSSLSPIERGDALKQIDGQLAESIPVRTSYLPMSKEQLLSLSNSRLFEVGSHTLNHRMLTGLSVDEQKHEIEQSKNALEKMTGKKIGSFSYPHGSYSAGTVALIRRAGFQLACGSRHANVQRNSDRHLLPRRVVNDWNAQEFERKLREWMES